MAEVAQPPSTSTEHKKKHKITSTPSRTTKKRKLESPAETTPSNPMPPTSQTLRSAKISSPYALTTASRYLSISPAYSSTPAVGIQRDHLDPLVFKYDPILNGIILLHQNLRFQSPAAKILGESPFAFVWCLVEFMLWKPTVGMVLEGFVNHVSPSHLGMLYGNVFSVSVTAAGIPGDWRFVAAEGGDGVGGEEEEVYTGDGGKRRERQKPVGGTDPIEGLTKAMGRWFDSEGNEVEGLRKFVVTAVKADGGMLSLEGSFKDEDVPSIVETTTGAPERQITQLHGKDLDEEDDNDDEEESKRRRKEKKEKKKRKREGKAE
ncbi:hypothetical protein TWF481_001576 [Arthrobotrys musiformis]|uniref:DNA-directed RNA polymerase subunit n=1 Tax=Arthrobotrys musiformis TaxID=47236 RepID=A0AAV9VTM1_9PEZI